jgi:hypothetical protein
MAFVQRALIEAQFESEGGRGAMQEAKACAELFEKPVEAEEEWGSGFDRRFEGERDPERVGKGFKLEDAFARVAGHFPEGIDFFTETFADVLSREREEFSEGGESPVGEVLKEGWGEVEFGEAEGCDERGRVFDEKNWVGAAGGAEGEGGLRGDAEASVDADAGEEAAQGVVRPRGPIISGGVDAGEIEEPAVSVRLFFDTG